MTFCRCMEAAGALCQSITTSVLWQHSAALTRYVCDPEKTHRAIPSLKRRYQLWTAALFAGQPAIWHCGRRADVVLGTFCALPSRLAVPDPPWKQACSALGRMARTRWISLVWCSRPSSPMQGSIPILTPPKKAKNPQNFGASEGQREQPTTTQADGGEI